MTPHLVAALAGASGVVGIPIPTATEVLFAAEPSELAVTTDPRWSHLTVTGTYDASAVGPLFSAARVLPGLRPLLERLVAPLAAVNWTLAVRESGDAGARCTFAVPASGRPERVVEALRGPLGWPEPVAGTLLEVLEAVDAPTVQRFALTLHADHAVASLTLALVASPAHLARRLDGVDAAARLLGVSGRQRAWLQAVLRGLSAGRDPAVLPVTVQVAPDGVVPQLRIAAYDVADRHVLKLVHPLGSGDRDAERWGRLSAVSADPAWHRLDVLARDTEPPGVDVTVRLPVPDPGA